MDQTTERLGKNDSPWFMTTDWHLVEAASGPEDLAANAALSRLCELYWYPLYTYIRRKGRDEEAARDLTQGFFLHLFERRLLEKASGESKFRSYLLACLNNYMISEWRKGQSQRRGEGIIPLSLDFETAEHRYRLEPPDPMTPEKAYERAWAQSVMEQAMAGLKDFYEEKGKTKLFERLKDWLTNDAGDTTMREVARELAMPEATLRVELHRLRKQMGEQLRQEIARTLSSEREVDDEVRYLLQILAGR